MRFFTIFTLLINTLFVQAQYYTFDKRCNGSEENVAEDAFRRGCGEGWNAEKGNPFIEYSGDSSGYAVLNNGDAIILNRIFDTCTIYNFTVKLKLKAPLPATVTFNFLKKSHVFSKRVELKPDYSYGWTTLLTYGVEFPADYDRVSVFYEGRDNQLYLDDLLITEYCPDQSMYKDIIISGKAEGKRGIDIERGYVIPGDTAFLIAEDYITLKGETVLSTGSEVTIRIGECKTKKSPCGNKPTAEEREFAIYNFISADNDGNNDTFFIETLENFPGTEVAVVNKGGNRVFYSDNYRNDWKADNVPPGVYVYQVLLPDGRLITGELLIKK